MPLSADRATGSLIAALRGLVLALILIWPAAILQAQNVAAEQQQWDDAVLRAQSALKNADTETAELERLREALQRMRSRAIEFELGATGSVADVNARLEALGPAPAEGATEAPEIAARRAAIGAELGEAQTPLIEAQDFQRRADAAIRDIDRIVRQRFADQLLSRGPSPLRPSHWGETVAAVVTNLEARIAIMQRALSDPESRDQLIRRVPSDAAAALVGTALVFWLRFRLIAWVEGQLGRARTSRKIALLVTLRNVSRLLVPAIGAGLLFAAFDPDHVIDPRSRSTYFDLPPFLLVIIGAGWLASSVFAPKLPPYRLAPVSDAAALSGARLTVSLGVLVAAQLFFDRYIERWEMTPSAAATLVFPLFAISGVLLWRTSRALRHLRRAIAHRERGMATPDRKGSLSLGLLALVARSIWLIAFAVPLLAALGFRAAADFLTFSTILTLGLIATVIVLFDLLATMVGALDSRDDVVHGASREGLAPVAIAAVLAVAALPLLALVWGARPSDVADVWYMLRDGVTLGGMRVSLGTITSFVVVFGLLFALTRLLQAVLRGTVLPRTRLDAGGRNAVLAGVGYLGFFIAVVAAVSSTGADLTSLAVVAGALSVGIGFGLQNIVSNFVSGIILLVERPIKEGDWIEVGGNMGYVRDISVRSTVIETFDRASLILPNSDLVAGTVLNRTHTGMSGRIQIPVIVAMESDPRKVERLLLDIAENHPLVLAEPQPVVLLMEIGPDALLFEIRCWLRDVNFSLSARSDINFEVLERLEAEGVRRQPYLREARRSSDPAGPGNRSGQPADRCAGGGRRGAGVLSGRLRA